jgi:hypothetical protein
MGDWDLLDRVLAFYAAVLVVGGALIGAIVAWVLF